MSADPCIVDEMKASGLTARSLRRSGQGDAAIAPPSPPDIRS
jgi:hypothetical protein